MGRSDDTNNLSKSVGPMNNKTINFSIYDLFSDCQWKGKLCNFKNVSALLPNYSIDFLKISLLLKRKIKNASADFDEIVRSYWWQNV